MPAVDRAAVEQVLIQPRQVVAGAEQAAGRHRMLGARSIVEYAAGPRDQLTVFFAIRDGAMSL